PWASESKGMMWKNDEDENENEDEDDEKMKKNDERPKKCAVLHLKT
ncbi:hypothetical protein CEXT_423891, partial [Caerostris extrusa]